jgi:hypothetical protein
MEPVLKRYLIYGTDQYSFLLDVDDGSVAETFFWTFEFEVVGCDCKSKYEIWNFEFSNLLAY